MLTKEQGIQEIEAGEGIPRGQIVEETVAEDSGQSPAVCLECGATCYSEPDADHNWCENCTNCSVRSLLHLMGLC